ncbi:MAG: acyl-CoA dehydrogenase family protein [Pseudomonadota bacterium]
MNFELSEEQIFIAEQVRGLLSDNSSFDRLRMLIDENAEWDERLWRQLAELGFLSAAIPEEYGGMGLTDLDLGVVSIEIGRANAAIPFFNAISFAASFILAADNDEVKQNWLPKIASGETVATVAIGEGSRGWRPTSPGVRFRSGKLNGRKWPVFDGGIADIAIVLVACEEASALALVQLDQPGVERRKLEGFDQLRSAYELDFIDAKAELLACSATFDQIIDKAVIQLAFESVGAAEACIHMAKDYAMDRSIFGRPLASYQAIKHRLADILVQTEFARSSAYYAAWAVSGAPEELSSAAASCQLTALSAFESAARENLQVHGGIGYTFEANCHFYYRRERMNAALLGPRSYWADKIISQLASPKVAKV